MAIRKAKLDLLGYIESGISHEKVMLVQKIDFLTGHSMAQWLEYGISVLFSWTRNFKLLRLAASLSPLRCITNYGYQSTLG